MGPSAVPSTMVLRGGEADAVQLPVDLGEHVGAGERRAPLGGGFGGGAGEVGQDLLAQIPGPQDR